MRIELLQGEEVEENGGLSPDWRRWMAKFEPTCEVRALLTPTQTILLFLFKSMLYQIAEWEVTQLLVQRRMKI